MDKKVFEYFQDLSRSDLERKDDAIIRNPNNIRIIDFVKPEIATCECNKTKYYLKKWIDSKKSLNSLVFSEIYSDAGIITPPIYLTVSDPKRQHPYDPTPVIWTLQQAVATIDKPIVHLGEYLYSRFATHRGNGLKEDRWAPIIDQQTKDIFLQYMTPECLDKLMNILFADELKTEFDRHYYNYFMVSSNNSGIYDDVVAIDLDESKISRTLTRKFNSIENINYPAITLAGTLDSFSIKQRIFRICNMLQSNQLSSSNIFTLKQMLSHDIDGTISKTINNPLIRTQDDHCFPGELSEHGAFRETYLKLWDYHRNTLGKELGL